MYDLFVIGGGPGGYTAAILAARKGLRTALAEKSQLGGTCTNSGCIPAKSYIESVGLYRKISQAARFGIEAGKPAITLASMARRAERIMLRLRKGIELLLKNSGVEYYPQQAEIIAPDTILIGEKKVQTRSILIATGATPKMPPVETPGILTSDTIFTLQNLPESMAIIGGGVIGCELAQVFSALGVKVSVIEAMERILATEDEEVSHALQKTMRGVDFYTGARVSAISGDGPYQVEIQTSEGEKKIPAEKILSAIGRRPVFPAGLKDLGIALNTAGGVKVDEYMRTSLPGVYAIGDVTGEYMLASVAAREALIAVENICGGQQRMRYANIPSIVFTDPEIASVGKPWQELNSAKRGSFPVAALGRARTMEAQEGFATVYADENDHIERISIMAPHATELITPAVLAIELGLSVEAFIQPHGTHPTLSELLKEAAEDVLGLSVNKI